MEQPISTAAEPNVPGPLDETASQAAGTLMWIGDRRRAEFQPAYAYCEQHAAQLAPRRDIADALARPATAVDRIVVARPTRLDPASDRSHELAARYPHASVVHLLGPLCAGECPGRLEPLGTSRFYWHQANQVLPKWFYAPRPDSNSAGSAPQAVAPPRSIAVIAATEAAADPLLDLAAAAGATAVWCRRADRFGVRNVDLVWWDDSAAPATNVETWRQRIASVSGTATGLRIRRDTAPGPSPRAVRHAWLAGGPTFQQCHQAREAGVQTVITKPAQIEPLLAMISPASSDAAFRRQEPIPAAGGAVAGGEPSVTRAA